MLLSLATSRYRKPIIREELDKGVPASFSEAYANLEMDLFFFFSFLFVLNDSS